MSVLGLICSEMLALCPEVQANMHSCGQTMRRLIESWPFEVAGGRRAARPPSLQGAARDGSTDLATCVAEEVQFSMYPGCSP